MKRKSIVMVVVFVAVMALTASMAFAGGPTINKTNLNNNMVKDQAQTKMVTVRNVRFVKNGSPSARGLTHEDIKAEAFF
ncbi:MAG: hypothetical protein H6684_04345 [Deltaproteobacteria bacterium]|nr:hypothetical protein [bacterium]MCB9487942.1 hypothetical protein [Deltaproteobacteria bacterium]